MVKNKPQKNKHCVDEETEILTVEKGWVTYKHLSVGNSVYCYDKKQDCLVVSKVQNIHVFREETQALSFNGYAIDMVVSPEHKCLANHKWSKGLRFVPAKNLNSSDSLLRCASYKAQKKPWYSDEFIRACAWIMTEGSYREDGSIVISQSFEVNAPYCADLDNLFKFLTTKPVTCVWEGKGGRIKRWRISGEIAEAMRSVMPEKIPLPRFCHRMTNPQRRLFLYEAIRGDGTWHRKEGHLPSPSSFKRNRDFFIRNKTPRIFQKKRVALDAFQLIATLAGIRSVIHRAYKNSKTGGWIISFTRMGRWTSVDKLTVSDTKVCLMWCPQTEFGTWVARRNGHVFITGNSHPGDAFGYGCAIMLPIIQRPKLPRVPKQIMQKRAGSYAARGFGPSMPSKRRTHG